MAKRKKTNYPGVFYREAERIGGQGVEKVFYVVFKRDGKIIEAKAGRQFQHDMTPARAALYRSQLIEGTKQLPREKRQAAQAAKDAEQARWTIDRIFDAYMENRRPGKAAGVDRQRFNTYLKKPFGDKEPAGIIPLDVDRVRRRLLKEKSPQTVKHVLNLLTWIVNYAKKKNLCEGLKFHVEKPTVKNDKTEDLTPDELQRLMAAIAADPNTQVANLMLVALYTGMRAGELFKLQWSHVDFGKGFIHIVAPKGGDPAVIPLNDAARKVLEGHPRTEGSRFIFPGANGGQRVTARVTANRIKAAAGLPDDFRPLHGLRHVFASNLASSGRVDLYVLQKLLTHKNPIMTQRYSHLRDAALRDASNIAGEIATPRAKEQTG